MLQLIFIFITTSSLPKQNKLSKNCDSNNNNNNNNNKSKSFLMGLLNLKVIKRYKNDSLFAYRCRDDRLSSVYEAMGLVRGHLIVQKQVNVITEVHISE